MNEEDLIEEASTAWRPRALGDLRYHPAWHDLTEEGRERAFEHARASRKVEAALDPEGFSSTVRAVLSKL